MAFDQTDTVVSFGANTQELEAGVNRVSNTLSGFANGTGSIFENLKNMVTGHVNGINDGIGGLKTGADGLSNIIEGIGSHFARLSALLAGGALFAEGIKAFSDETAETKKLMNGLGMTAEAA
jgi:phage-related protein